MNKGNKVIQVGVRMEVELEKTLRKEAEKLGHTLASYIRFLLMTRHERPKKP
jgi:predicted DNA-binding protein